MIKLNSIKLNDGSHGLPKNPRFIKDDRFKSLCESIKTNPEYMPARPIVVDENNIILGGNMRWRACKELGMSEIPASWIKQVDGWSIEKKRRFILLDNRSWGDDDWDLLANEWDVDELIGAGFSDDDLKGIIGSDETYTRKIESPIYEATGKKPEVSDLYNTEKQEELLKRIKKAKIPEDVKRFLEAASSRHIVFHYGNIAEFYVHSDKEVQELFEDSVLVIIDFDDAIEKGFVRLAETTIALYREMTRDAN